MKHQQVVPDYSAMIQTSGTVLCLVFSGWVLFRLLQAVFWLPGYLEKTQGKLYDKLENRATTKANISNAKAKAKDSDAEEEDDNDVPRDDLAATDGHTEKGNDDANESEKGGDIDSGNKKDN